MPRDAGYERFAARMARKLVQSDAGAAGSFQADNLHECGRDNVVGFIRTTPD